MRTIAYELRIVTMKEGIYTSAEFPAKQKHLPVVGSLQIKAVTSQIPFCIMDNGIWRGRSDRFNIGLICND